jgi:superoxide dismutase, Fe-Mn family
MRSSDRKDFICFTLRVRSSHLPFAIRGSVAFSLSRFSKAMSGLIVESALRAAAHIGSSKVPSHIAKSSAALFTAFGGAKPSLPDLPYDYGALARKLSFEKEAFERVHSFAWLISLVYLSFFEAAISAETMTIHHTKHHNTYITNLNTSLAKLDAAMITGDLSGIVILQNAIRFNGGGHINHSLFWENLTPEKNEPSGSIEAAIRESFGDFKNMKDQLTAKTVAIQGSGWGWLAYDKMTGMCAILRISVSRLPRDLLIRSYVVPLILYKRRGP